MEHTCKNCFWSEKGSYYEDLYYPSDEYTCFATKFEIPVQANETCHRFKPFKMVTRFKLEYVGTNYLTIDEVTDEDYEKEVNQNKLFLKEHPNAKLCLDFLSYSKDKVKKYIFEKTRRLTYVKYYESLAAAKEGLTKTEYKYILSHSIKRIRRKETLND